LDLDLLFAETIADRRAQWMPSGNREACRESQNSRLVAITEHHDCDQLMT
jgi:hypothetical protein